nr:collagen alpha-1(I) chain-like [Caretta caretta]
MPGRADVTGATAVFPRPPRVRPPGRTPRRRRAPRPGTVAHGPVTPPRPPHTLSFYPRRRSGAEDGGRGGRGPSDRGRTARAGSVSEEGGRLGYAHGGDGRGDGGPAADPARMEETPSADPGRPLPPSRLGGVGHAERGASAEGAPGTLPAPGAPPPGSHPARGEASEASGGPGSCDAVGGPRAGRPQPSGSRINQVAALRRGGAGAPPLGPEGTPAQRAPAGLPPGRGRSGTRDAARERREEDRRGWRSPEIGPGPPDGWRGETEGRRGPDRLAGFPRLFPPARPAESAPGAAWEGRRKRWGGVRQQSGRTGALSLLFFPPVLRADTEEGRREPDEGESGSRAGAGALSLLFFPPVPRADTEEGRREPDGAGPSRAPRSPRFSRWPSNVATRHGGRRARLPGKPLEKKSATQSRRTAGGTGAPARGRYEGPTDGDGGSSHPPPEARAPGACVEKDRRVRRGTAARPCSLSRPCLALLSLAAGLGFRTPGWAAGAARPRAAEISAGRHTPTARRAGPAPGPPFPQGGKSQSAPGSGNAKGKRDPKPPERRRPLPPGLRPAKGPSRREGERHIDRKASGERAPPPSGGRRQSEFASRPPGLRRGCEGTTGSPEVYRPSQTPHLTLSPERVAPGTRRALGARSESPSGLAPPPHRRLFTLETCCGYGYGPARDLHHLPRIFKGQRELTGRRRNRDAFQGSGPSLGANPFQGALPFTKKRELSPGLPPASPGSVALPHWTPRGAHLRHSGFGDLNPTPFRSAEGNGGHRPSLRNGARLSLRTD